MAPVQADEDDSPGHALRSHLLLPFRAGKHPGLFLPLHSWMAERLQQGEHRRKS